MSPVWARGAVEAGLTPGEGDALMEIDATPVIETTTASTFFLKQSRSLLFEICKYR